MGKVRKFLGKVKRKILKPKPTTQNAKKPAAPAPKTNVLLKENPVTIKDLKPGYCCGCSACASVCPTGAITMGVDERGYMNPQLDFDKCISCRKCAKTCPVMNTKHKNNPQPDCYAVMADDETRRNSSSGGTFSIAANIVLENGGYVCGAAFTDNFNVEHIIISDKSELHRLRGSKYVQSNMNNAFKRVKELLDSGKQVLFSGCPCQVAGLANYLGKEYDNLMTLDIVCHGTPSQGVFHRYLDEYYGRENLSEFKFRTKEYGYNCVNQVAYLRDGTKIAANIKFDPYERTMHSGLVLKDVCGDCPFAAVPRQGDISTGDFWGISKHDPALNDNLGTSVTLINNEKGKAFFEKMKKNAKLFTPVPFDVAKANNRFGRKISIPAGRDWYFKMAEGQSFEKSVDYALKRHYDVGVIGLWYGRNYGSMATYFALHQVLTNKFHLSVLMIDNPLGGAGEYDDKVGPGVVARRFYDMSKRYKLDDLGVLNNTCDSFIVGSDQLWNVGLSRPYRQMYYLGFVNDMNKKIAYGTSFGHEYRGNEEEKLVSSHNLRRFDHVSVRDKLSYDIATNQFGVDNVTEVCDPTFLCPLEEYQKLIDLNDRKQDGKFLLAYILDPSEQIGKELEKISEEQNCKIVVVLNEPPKTWEDNKNRLCLTGKGNIEVRSEVTLFEWLWLYQNTEAVLTDSFHGTIFSLIFEKPFITLINRKRGGERFISLLTPLGLLDRLFENPTDFSANKEMLKALDYTDVNKRLNEIRSNSMNWLENALFSKKTFKSSRIYSIQDAREDKPQT